MKSTIDLQEIKKSPSYQRRQYYEKRLKEKADKIYEEKTRGLRGDDFIEAITELEGVNQDAFIGRIHFNISEAHSIIKFLATAKEHSKKEKHRIEWVPVWNGIGSKNSQATYREMTIPEMVSRLEYISNENFDYDIDEWEKWLEAWELYPIPTGSR